MESVLKQLAGELEGRAVVGKVYSNERGPFNTYGIRLLPTIMLFRDGEVKESFVGARSKDILQQAIEKYVP